MDACCGVTLLPGIELQQDSEQRGHDGDAAAHQGDIQEGCQQRGRDRGWGELHENSKIGEVVAAAEHLGR